MLEFVQFLKDVLVVGGFWLVCIAIGLLMFYSDGIVRKWLFGIIWRIIKFPFVATWRIWCFFWNLIPGPFRQITAALLGSVSGVWLYRKLTAKELT